MLPQRRLHDGVAPRGLITQYSWFKPCVATLTLIPLYKLIYLCSRGLPSESLFSYFHYSGEVLINQGWLWFLPILFLFDTLYLGLSKIPLPFDRIGTRLAISVTFILGTAYCVAISLNGWIGWTKTMLVDFQNERLLLYFMTFLLGATFYRVNAFHQKPTRQILYYVACGTIWIPMNAYVIFLLNLLFNPGHFIVSSLVDRIILWSGFNLSMLGMLYIMICSFWFYLDKNGKWLNILSRNSYGVYIIHFIVMGGVALLTLNLNAPSLVKYFTVTVLTIIISNFLVSGYIIIKRKRLSHASRFTTDPLMTPRG